MQNFEEMAGPPERTYHGIVNPRGNKVLIKEEGLKDAWLQGIDGSTDFNWGYGGGGPRRLANALVSDALDDVTYAETLGFQFNDALITTLEHNQPFVLSRDRILLEGLIYFTHFINKSRLPKGDWLRRDIQELIARQDEVRAKILGLLSRRALINITESGLGIKIDHDKMTQ